MFILVEWGLIGLIAGLLGLIFMLAILYGILYLLFDEDVAHCFVSGAMAGIVSALIIGVIALFIGGFSWEVFYIGAAIGFAIGFLIGWFIER
ncbi:hypothetical protein [Alistipes sp.]|jgi:hypothetical protein|uniref:hypothetical protein n=1 Tax=Alistipes sp. TaxID=1872444 RepID=UPI00307D9AC6